MPLFNVYLLLLAFYIITCLWVVIKFYKRDKGVFQAPFIFSLASMLMMVPQFCVIIYNPYYNPEILWDLTYCMVTGTIAFSLGWDKAQRKPIYKCKDIKLQDSKWIFFLLFLIGVYCSIQSSIQAANFFSSGGDNIRGNHTFQIFLFFRLYFDVGLFYALTYIIKEKKIPLFIYIIVIIGCLYYLYIIGVYARRSLVVKLFMSLGLLLIVIRPQWQNIIKIIVVIFFITGTIYQASIGSIRNNLQNSAEKENINIWENYKQSYIAPNLVHGMDLGNGALFIKYTKEHNTYNGGLFLWNDIVTWYCPSFIFGKEGKENLKLAEWNNKYIEEITHGVTTTTGYYQAFAAFWYFGFIAFYALGLILGHIWKRIEYSSLYLILYLCFMYNIPNISSHGFSYVIGQIETFLVFCLPIIYHYTYNKRYFSSHKGHKRLFNYNKF
jgi:hypothetical protein